MQIETTQPIGALTSDELTSLNVLVVDDEPSICETLKLFLDHLGIGTIQTAEDGSKALQSIKEITYDYVFVDLMMPEVNGMEVLSSINQHHQPTSVIIMTGYPTMDVVIEAMHHGASDFLVKPFRFEDVKLALERIQRLHQLMEKNWLLNQELEKKKEVEELNTQLENKIRLQTILYNIVDSLSHMNRSDSLYHLVISKAMESVKARKACFMIYDQNNAHLVVLAQNGMKKIRPGSTIRFGKDEKGQGILDRTLFENFFESSIEEPLLLYQTNRSHGFMTIPFNIRNEPFGLLFVGEKKDGGSFDGEDEFIVKFLAEKAALNIENMALYNNLKQSLLATLMSLVSAIEAKDSYTKEHSKRVTDYSVRIARKMNCSYYEIQKLETNAPLHDIGKIGINDAILNKPDRLTDEEFDHIKAHPIIGENIVSPLGLDRDALSIIRNHHERWDGKGYPDRLKGKEIPKLSRILCVADAFDAMNSSRAYRKALPFPVCFKELKRNSGTQFDPEVVNAALEVLSK